jgi:hypothetical protein
VTLTDYRTVASSAYQVPEFRRWRCSDAKSASKEAAITSEQGPGTITAKPVFSQTQQKGKAPIWVRGGRRTTCVWREIAHVECGMYKKRKFRWTGTVQTLVPSVRVSRGSWMASRNLEMIDRVLSTLKARHIAHWSYSKMTGLR